MCWLYTSFIRSIYSNSPEALWSLLHPSTPKVLHESQFTERERTLDMKRCTFVSCSAYFHFMVCLTSTNFLSCSLSVVSVLLSLLKVVMLHSYIKKWAFWTTRQVGPHCRTWCLQRKERTYLQVFVLLKDECLERQAESWTVTLIVNHMRTYSMSHQSRQALCYESWMRRL